MKTYSMKEMREIVEGLDFKVLNDKGCLDYFFIDNKRGLTIDILRSGAVRVGDEYIFVNEQGELMMFGKKDDHSQSFSDAVPFYGLNEDFYLKMPPDGKMERISFPFTSNVHIIDSTYHLHVNVPDLSRNHGVQYATSLKNLIVCSILNEEFLLRPPCQRENGSSTVEREYSGGIPPFH